MQKIVVYDTEHFETTYALLKILDLPSTSISVFTDHITADILHQMLGKDAEKFDWIIIQKKGYNYIFRLYNYCLSQQVSILFLNTVSYHHLFFAIICRLLPTTRKILTIHAANSFFKPYFKITPREIIKYIGKKSLAKSVSSFATLLSSTSNYIYKNYNVSKPIHCIPGSIFELQNINSTETHLNTSFKIVIPGSIDQFRRNYNIVFDLADHLDKIGFTGEIILLGSAIGYYGAKVLERCQKSNYKHLRLGYYTSHFVDQVEYELQLKSCDFIYLPLEKYCYKPGEQKEEYGLTICSGSFFDAIRFAKPIILSKDIVLASELKDQCIQYESPEQLSSLLINLSQIQIEEIKKEAFENSLHFNVELIRESLKDLLSPC